MVSLTAGGPQPTIINRLHSEMPVERGFWTGVRFPSPPPKQKESAQRVGSFCFNDDNEGIEVGAVVNDSPVDCFCRREQAACGAIGALRRKIPKIFFANHTNCVHIILYNVWRDYMEKALNDGFKNLGQIIGSTPDAAAVMQGGIHRHTLGGVVLFFKTKGGVLVAAEIRGLPQSADECKEDIFAFHIHEGDCDGDGAMPFPDSGGHYNPNGCAHPMHAGDMPPLFGTGGLAVSVFLTNRFTLDEIIGRSVIIHSRADDFSSQPSGNAGEKIACGRIIKTK